MTNGTERLRFDYAKITSQSETDCLIEVGLTFAHRPIQKSMRAGQEPMEQLRAIAQVTLEAIKDAVEDRFDCRIADLDHVYALGKNLIAVLIDIDFESKQIQVFGSCQIMTTEADATAKATLNATNRFVELAMRG